MAASLLRARTLRAFATTTSAATGSAAPSQATLLRELSNTSNKRVFVPLSPALAKQAAQCVGETFATQDDPFTWCVLARGRGRASWRGEGDVCVLSLPTLSRNHLSFSLLRAFRRLFNLKRHHWNSLSGMFIERSAQSACSPSAPSGRRPLPDPALPSLPLPSAALPAAGPQLSVVALNPATGKVDGVMINEGACRCGPLSSSSPLPSH
jgi:hypothetical protein